jgi:hypothetical protein
MGAISVVLSGIFLHSIWMLITFNDPDGENFINMIPSITVVHEPSADELLVENNGFSEPYLSKLGAFMSYKEACGAREANLMLTHVYDLDLVTAGKWETLTVIREPLMFLLVTRRSSSATLQKILCGEVACMPPGAEQIFKKVAVAAGVGKCTGKVIGMEWQGSLTPMLDDIFPDAVAILASEVSPIITEWLYGQDFRIVEYFTSEKRDEFKFMLPHSKVHPVHLDRQKQDTDMRVVTTNVLTVDAVIAARENKPISSAARDAVILAFGDDTLNMYYHQVFKFHIVEGFNQGMLQDALEEKTRWYDNIAVNADMKVSFPIPGAVFKQSHRDFNVMVVPSRKVGGVPFAIGERVLITGQSRTGENDMYYVHVSEEGSDDDAPGRAVLANAITVKFDHSRHTIQNYNDMRGPRAEIRGVPVKYKDIWNIIDGDRVYVTDLQMVGRAWVQKGADVATLVVHSPRNDDDPINFVCWENSIVPNGALCEETGLTWDRACVRDIDCPFYEEKVGRGGCGRSGYCEMPLGVARRGFRKVDDRVATKPLCRECDDGLGDCCTKGPYGWAGSNPSLSE